MLSSRYHGGRVRHCGANLAGKDCTKVGRVATYYARYMAKNIVAAGLASECEVELHCLSGEKFATNLILNTFNTETVPIEVIYLLAKATFTFSIKDMVSLAKDHQVPYTHLDAWGHFTIGAATTNWEQTDKSSTLHIRAKRLSDNFTDWLKRNTLETIQAMSDLEIMQWALERPNHQGVYGFMIPADMLKDDAMANKYTALVNRICTMDKNELAEELALRDELLEMYDSE